MFTLRRVVNRNVLQKLQAKHPSHFTPPILFRLFSKASTMTFDEMSAEVDKAKNLLDVQRISVELFSDQDFLGKT